MIALSFGCRSKALGIPALGLAALLLLTSSCGGDGGGGTQTAVMTCSSSDTVGANQVAMRCGVEPVNDQGRVDVVLGGPASGEMTVRGFNFDITYDPTKVEYVPSSGFTSPLFVTDDGLQTALVVVALADGQQGRVVVSVQQPGDLPAQSVDAGTHEVVSLWFRRVVGETFGPTGLAFDNAEATGASVSIEFGSDLSLACQ